MNDTQTTHAEPEDVVLEGGSLRIYRDAPSWEGGRTATIGRFDFPSEGAAYGLVQEACLKLKDEGFDSVIGPMEGDTWHAYRTVMDTDGSPPFLMEPRSGLYDSGVLVATGFEPISVYISSRAPVAEAGSTPIQVPGITVEPWDGQRAEALLGYLFDMSLDAFAKNSFYKPIAREDFLAMYASLVPRLDKDLIMFAKDETGAIVGFLFGFGDASGGTRRAILKTYASRRPGAGRMLASHFHHVARDKGYVETIHALMHSSNQSLRRSRLEGGIVFRHYALLGKKLRP